MRYAIASNMNVPVKGSVSREMWGVFVVKLLSRRMGEPLHENISVEHSRAWLC